MKGELYMFYLKTKINDSIEIKVPLLSDEIYTKCLECRREIEVDAELLQSVLEDGDLSSSSIICEVCTLKKEAI